MAAMRPASDTSSEQPTWGRPARGGGGVVRRPTCGANSRRRICPSDRLRPASGPSALVSPTRPPLFLT